MVVIKKYCENAHVFLVNEEGATVKLTFIFFMIFSLYLSLSLSALCFFLSNFSFLPTIQLRSDSAKFNILRTLSLSR